MAFSQRLEKMAALMRSRRYNHKCRCEQTGCKICKLRNQMRANRKRWRETGRKPTKLMGKPPIPTNCKVCGELQPSKFLAGVHCKSI